MPRPLLILIVVIVVVFGGIALLSTQAKERPVTRVEKPVTLANLQ